MKTARAVLLIAALSAAPIAAKPSVPKGCELIAALAQPDDAALRGIRIDVDHRGRSSVSYRGKRSALNGASDCEVSGPTDIFEVLCYWEFGTDAAAALREYTRLRGALAECLPGGFAPDPFNRGIETLRVTVPVTGKFDRGEDESEGSVSLARHTHLEAGEASMESVALSISR